MHAIIKTTNDGSSTIYVPALNEHYHSVHGAYNESLHVFINMGLKAVNKKTVSIFEVGFGTGLNTILSVIYSSKNKIAVNYTGIEKYPVNDELLAKINYSEFIPEGYASLFQQIHQLGWDEQHKINEYFQFSKLLADIKTMTPEGRYDIIYFDAFAPEKQESMWSEAVFSKLHTVLNEGGFLVTYCAKGNVRRRLISIGFKVERLPGPPGKREMLRATKLV